MSTVHLLIIPGVTTKSLQHFPRFRKYNFILKIASRVRSDILLRVLVLIAVTIENVLSTTALLTGTHKLDKQ